MAKIKNSKSFKEVSQDKADRERLEAFSGLVHELTEEAGQKKNEEIVSLTRVRVSGLESLATGGFKFKKVEEADEEPAANQQPMKAQVVSLADMRLRLAKLDESEQAPSSSGFKFSPGQSTNKP